MWSLVSSDIEQLIARGKYARAAKLLADQVEAGNRDPRTRLRLADVLVLENRGYEALPILFDLADDYASEGQGAKAIAILKKIQRLNPGDREASMRLAKVIKSGKKAPPIDPALYASGQTFGVEHFEQSNLVEPPTDDRFERLKAQTWVPSTHQDEPPTIAEPVAPAAPLPVSTPAPPPAPVADEDFAIEITPEPLVPDTPLFGGFSQDELVAVIQGLELKTFEPGDMIILEGDPGTSLFIITTGNVKAFVRDPKGGTPLLVRRMKEGDFFGEISILSGKPRTASVVAATPCEMLELDRKTLDQITATYPHVRQVLEEFYINRASTQDEAIRQNLEEKRRTL
jgi:hypothetical protein